MTGVFDQSREAFRRRFSPREFQNVVILAFGDRFSPDDLQVLSAGVVSMAGVGKGGFVFELSQFHNHGDIEERLGNIVTCMVEVYGVRGALNWLHGARFVQEWKRLKIMSPPPSNFEIEKEAIEQLRNLLEASRIALEASHIAEHIAERLTDAGISAREIANMAGLFEDDVRRLAAGQPAASPEVVMLIASALDSLEAQKKPAKYPQ